MQITNKIKAMEALSATGLYPEKAWDYDADHFVVLAYKDPKNKREMDPYYGVDKNTGEVTSFSPAGNPAKWAKVVREEEQRLENSDEVLHSILRSHDNSDYL